MQIEKDRVIETGMETITLRRKIKKGRKKGRITAMKRKTKLIKRSQSLNLWAQRNNHQVVKLQNQKVQKVINEKENSNVNLKKIFK